MMVLVVRVGIRFEVVEVCCVRFGVLLRLCEVVVLHLSNVVWVLEVKRVEVKVGGSDLDRRCRLLEIILGEVVRCRGQSRRFPRGRCGRELHRRQGRCGRGRRLLRWIWIVLFRSLLPVVCVLESCPPVGKVL